MEKNLMIDTETFDFDFWTNNKVKILLLLEDRGRVEDISTLALLARLSYATTHDIFRQLEQTGLHCSEGTVTSSRR
jgi:hypothetical protein